MQHLFRKLNTLLFSSVLTVGTLYAPLSYSGPGTLADAPLFLSNAVQPNIAIMLDDSGSMDWESLLNNGTQFPGQALSATFTFFGFLNLNLNNIDGTPDNERERRLTCRGFNIMAYDPNIEYTPWLGEDNAGNTYKNLTLTTARYNPYDAASITNISGDTFFRWSDNGDGEYDGPGSTDVDAPANAATDECGDVSSNANGTAVADLDLIGTSANPDSQQNYANWWSYYRKREYAAKRALSDVIFNSTARIGLARLNRPDTESIDIDDIDNFSLPVDSDAQQHKDDLLSWLFSRGSANGTPLRSALQRAGEYFEDNNSDWGSTPILSSAQGGECQGNYTVLMSDGFWNGILGTETFIDDDGNPFDVTMGAEVGDTDIDSSNIFDGGTHVDSPAAGDASSNVIVNGSGTPISVENTLADVAMHYYERDLSNLANRVPPTASDPEAATLPNSTMHQHMKTYTVAFGVKGALNSNPDARDSDPGFPGWPTPDPEVNNAAKIDDMRHAAWNGRGEFLSAGDTQMLIDGLNETIANIAGTTSAAASVTFNTNSLSTNSNVYLSLFNNRRWSGNLEAYPLDPNTGDVINTPSWRSASVLDNRNLTSNDRTILSYKKVPGTDGDGNPITIASGIPFQWSNLTDSQKDDLRTNSDNSPANDATALARLEYIRGQRSCEANSTGSCTHTDPADSSITHTAKNLRERDSRLGDLINSAPTFVGAPEVNWPDSLVVPSSEAGANYTVYSTFRNAESGRDGVVYVGGNDGMLHGFAEDDGEEILAYIPSFLFSTALNEGMHYLTYPQYNHRFYVDLSPTVSDAYIRTTTGGTRGWKSILIGGARAGGKGIFALDVTNPVFSETNADATVMWEFTSEDDADLGFTFSRPIIVPLNNDKWGAIFGNGYNSDTGIAQLFIVFLEEGLDGEWTIDTNANNGDYVKISTGVGDTTNRNGLATPAVVDLDGDSIADRVYAGDLEGNMWTFDISSNEEDNWGVAYSGKPLFTAEVGTGTSAYRQQITTTPAIVRHPDIPTSNQNDPNVLVLFGTGQYLTQNDISNTSVQSFYGIWDHGDSEIGRNTLVEQDIGSASTAVGGFNGRTLTNNDVTYDAPGNNNDRDGWYIDFDVQDSSGNPTAPGERVVTDAVIRGDLIFFVTTIPEADPCGTGGRSFLMVAEFRDGSRPEEVAFDINNDGKIDDSDFLVVGGVNQAAGGEEIDGIAAAPTNLGNKQYIVDSNTTNGEGIDDRTLIDIGGNNTGRLSWEELAR